MEALIKIILICVAVMTCLVFFLQCLNMAIVLYKGRGDARISIPNAIIAVVTLYVLTLL
jgi:hypothetical protein